MPDNPICWPPVRQGREGVPRGQEGLGRTTLGGLLRSLWGTDGLHVRLAPTFYCCCCCCS